MRTNHKLIGEHIRKMRVLKKLTQAELAELIGTSCPYLSQLETGHRKISLDILMRIANALEITTDSLLLGTNLIYEDRFQLSMIELFEDCSCYEKQVILETAIALKSILKTEQQYLKNTI